MKLTIKINNKDHEISPQEARRLHSELSELFRKEPSSSPLGKQKHPPMGVEPWQAGGSQWDPNIR